MKYSEPDYKRIAFTYGVAPKEVEDIYKSVFKYIYEHVSKFDFENMTEEEFNKKRTTFIIPPLGRLYTTYDHAKRVTEHLIYARDKHQEGKAAFYKNSSDKK